MPPFRWERPARGAPAALLAPGGSAAAVGPARAQCQLFRKPERFLVGSGRPGMALFPGEDYIRASRDAFVDLSHVYDSLLRAELRAGPGERPSHSRAPAIAALGSGVNKWTPAPVGPSGRASPDSRTSADGPGKVGEGECLSSTAGVGSQGVTLRRGSVRSQLQMPSPCRYKEAWACDPGVGFFRSEVEERDPQPDEDLGSRFVEGGALVGAQKGRDPFILVHPGRLQR